MGGEGRRQLMSSNVEANVRFNRPSPTATTRVGERRTQPLQPIVILVETVSPTLQAGAERPLPQASYFRIEHAALTGAFKFEAEMPPLNSGVR